MKIFKSLIRFFTFRPAMWWHGELARECTWQEERKRNQNFPFQDGFVTRSFLESPLCPLIFRAWLTKGHILVSHDFLQGKTAPCPTQLYQLSPSTTTLSIRCPQNTLQSFLDSLNLLRAQTNTHPSSLFLPLGAPRKKHIFLQKNKGTGSHFLCLSTENLAIS